MVPETELAPGLGLQPAATKTTARRQANDRVLVLTRANHSNPADEVQSESLRLRVGSAKVGKWEVARRVRSHSLTFPPAHFRVGVSQSFLTSVPPHVRSCPHQTPARCRRAPS